MKPLALRPTSGPIRAGATIIVAGQAPSVPTFNAKDGAAVGSLPTSPELAAPAHLFVDPNSGLPMVVIVTRDLGKGATVSLITRGIDPAPAPFATLPGAAITTLPPLSTPAEPQAPRERRPD